MVNKCSCNDLTAKRSAYLSDDRLWDDPSLAGSPLVQAGDAASSGNLPKLPNPKDLNWAAEREIRDCRKYAIMKRGKNLRIAQLWSEIISVVQACHLQHFDSRARHLCHSSGYNWGEPAPTVCPVPSSHHDTFRHVMR